MRFPFSFVLHPQEIPVGVRDGDMPECCVFARGEGRLSTGLDVFISSYISDIIFLNIT
jgi:hypothetical protein